MVFCDPLAFVPVLLLVDGVLVFISWITQGGTVLERRRKDNFYSPCAVICVEDPRLLSIVTQRAL